MKVESTIILILLAILSVSELTRSLVFVAFEDNIFNLDKSPAMEDIIQKILLIFDTLPDILAIVILYYRQLQNDLLTYILIFFIIVSIQRFYYEYLYFYHPKSQTKIYLDKIQDIISIIVFLSSMYIMKFVLF
jgi:hypothetical protein